ncbi:hypothetical protein E4U21_007597 [Claviceps maximensis]|nr:hypothetical protein E4U21_007597 [Claviceps maximensis]
MVLKSLVKGLRAAELACAVVVTGIVGFQIWVGDSASFRSIYMVIVSSMTVLASLRALGGVFPFSAMFVHWPVDVCFSMLWWAAFGLIVQFASTECHGSCYTLNAVLAFSSSSGLLWLASASMGIFPVRSREHRAAEVKGSGGCFVPTQSSLSQETGVDTRKYHGGDSGVE